MSGNHVIWALIDKDNSGLGSWTPTNASRVLSDDKDLSQGGRRLQLTREQKRARGLDDERDGWFLRTRSRLFGRRRSQHR
ncbi:hypothetical protein GJ744_004488 [Endocarpon pusillum]|uniref:Uncharacterized protein n=1 Tax=Endocarpon pusillum TaxID=364733 RepID=A0A8H7ART4_9EURO|nr:hypothetical protein GJ744_004488 [Endocarpon pusillum]